MKRPKRPKKRREKPASPSQPAGARASSKDAAAAVYGEFWRAVDPSRTTTPAEDAEFVALCRELDLDPVRMDELARASWREARRRR